MRLAALDMLAQAEHGEGSLVVAVSPEAEVCEALAQMLERLVLERPTVGEAQFAIVHVESPRAAIEFANAFAPEHLQLIGAAVEALAPAVQAAGCVFVGWQSATAFGDYVAGSNHVLPTSGAARFASALSPRHFRRTWQRSASARQRPGSPPPARRSPGRRASRCTPSRWRRE